MSPIDVKKAMITGNQKSEPRARSFEKQRTDNFGLLTAFQIVLLLALIKPEVRLVLQSKNQKPVQLENKGN